MKAPGLTLELHCPHCGKDSRVTIGAAESRPTALIEPPSARVLTTKSRVCGCGHGAEFHGSGGKGPCTYGHGTALGGCRDCPRYHRRGTHPAAAPSPLTNGLYQAAGLSKMGRRILTAVAQRGGRPTSDAQIVILAGYKRSGSFTTELGDLRRAGWLDGPGEANVLTTAGAKVLGPVDPLPTGPDLLSHWEDKLGPMCGRILRAVVDAYPRAFESQTGIAAKAGYRESGSFTTALGTLRRLEMVDGLRASEVLMASMRGES